MSKIVLTIKRKRISITVQVDSFLYTVWKRLHTVFIHRAVHRIQIEMFLLLRINNTKFFNQHGNVSMEIESYTCRSLGYSQMPKNDSMELGEGGTK